MTSGAEAQAAERGGADRLELVRDLDVGGLSPSLDIVAEVLATSSIPVRVMLRETPDFTAGNKAAIEELEHRAMEFRLAGANQFVMGFIRDGMIDEASIGDILGKVPGCQVTFHRAIEAVTDPISAVGRLKTFQQIDRVLTSGPPGDWGAKREFLEQLQEASRPDITVVVGGGLDENSLALVAQSELLNEFHVGKAARDSSGVVSKERVRHLCQQLRA